MNVSYNLLSALPLTWFSVQLLILEKRQVCQFFILLFVGVFVTLQVSIETISVYYRLVFGSDCCNYIAFCSTDDSFLFVSQIHVVSLYNRILVQ